MQTQLRIADPFAMLIDPQAVLQEIEKSERLKALHSRVCRPLDRVVTPKVDGAVAFDAEVDGERSDAE